MHGGGCGAPFCHARSPKHRRRALLAQMSMGRATPSTWPRGFPRHRGLRDRPRPNARGPGGFALSFCDTLASRARLRPGRFQCPPHRTRCSIQVLRCLAWPPSTLASMLAQCSPPLLSRALLVVVFIGRSRCQIRVQRGMQTSLWGTGGGRQELARGGAEGSREVSRGRMGDGVWTSGGERASIGRKG